MIGAGRRVGEAEFKVRGRLDLAQDFQRRRHHFGTDAIAAEHGDVEGVVGGHGDSLALRALLASWFETRGVAALLTMRV